MDVGIQPSRRVQILREGRVHRDPVRCADARRCTTQQRNTHSTESREVRYRWHPWFGLVVWVHLTRVIQAQDVVRCALTPELGAHATEIPLWMFDAAACVLMDLADEPTVDVEALRELSTLLRHVRGPSDAAVPMLQAEHRSLSSAGGAHAIDFEAAATGDPTGAVPRVSQRAELERRPARGSTAGVATAEPACFATTSLAGGAKPALQEDRDE